MSFPIGDNTGPYQLDFEGLIAKQNHSGYKITLKNSSNWELGRILDFDFLIVYKGHINIRIIPSRLFHYNEVND
jgi:hypothetical protein